MPEARRLRASSRFAMAFASEVEGNVPRASMFSSIGLDEEVQSTTVGKLIRLVFRRRVYDGKLGEGHAGTTSQVHISYPQLYPDFEEKS